MLVEDAGLCCPRCGNGARATYHGRLYRKQVRDLATGELFEAIPILRAHFCSKTTRSIPLADQLERLLHDLTGDLQLAFRRATGHSVLDRQSVQEAPRSMRFCQPGSGTPN